MRANARWWIGVSMVVVLARTAVGQAAPPIAQFVPPAPNPAHVFVLDSAHILSDSMVAMLQDSSRALQAATGADVAWVTLPTLGGRPVEEAALYIGRTWRIGSEGQAGDPLRNRGLVILYVPDKTTTAGPNFRIEVGNGLEGTITDSRSRNITNAMRAGLRAKHYDTAYLAGWVIAASLVREDFAGHGLAQRPTPERQPRSVELTQTFHGPSVFSVAIPLFFLLVIIVLFILLVGSRRRARGGPSPMVFLPSTDADDVRRRTDPAPPPSTSSWDFGGGGGGGSDGGSFGGGGGFSGGGSSDTI